MGYGSVDGVQITGMLVIHTTEGFAHRMFPCIHAFGSACIEFIYTLFKVHRLSNVFTLVFRGGEGGRPISVKIPTMNKCCLS